MNKSNALQIVFTLFILCSIAIGADIVSFTFKVANQPTETFEVEMPDGSLQTAIEAFSVIYQRPAKIQDKDGNEIDNPVSKSRFMASKVREFCVEVTKAYTIQEAQKASLKKASDNFKLIEDSIKVKTP